MAIHATDNVSDVEHVIDKIEAHGLLENDNVLYHIHRFGYAPSEDTREYPNSLPTSVIQKFRRRHEIPIPDSVIAQAIFG